MYKKILVPLDGTKNDEVILDHVRDLAKALGSSLVLIQLFRVIKSEDPFFKNVQMETGASGALAKEKAESYLPGVAETIKTEGVDVSTEFLIVDEPEADEIVKYALDNGCDLIALTNQERTGLGRWFFANIEEKVKRRSSLPILLVGKPHHKEKSP